ncbi:MAG: MFS transporter, partial [Clostridia bacterium]|nr:MFS transporter [Clostridia bacterium]
MQATSKKSGLFYGWVIVGLGCLVMAVIMGIIYNCFSQFIKPVGDALGFSRQQMSICQTLISLSQVII